MSMSAPRRSRSPRCLSTRTTRPSASLTTLRCSASRGLQRTAALSSVLALRSSAHLPKSCSPSLPRPTHPPMSMFHVHQPQARRCLASIALPKLDDGSHSTPGVAAVVAGWGHTSEGGSSPDELHSSGHVKQPVVLSHRGRARPIRGSRRSLAPTHALSFRAEIRPVLQVAMGSTHYTALHGACSLEAPPKVSTRLAMQALRKAHAPVRSGVRKAAWNADAGHGSLRRR